MTTQRGGVIKITIWLARTERHTWIMAAEVFVLHMILLTDPGLWIRLLLGLPLLVHVGYSAITSLPMGAVPRRPERGQPRRNNDLRASVKRFLDEVRRAEDLAHRDELAQLSQREREWNLFTAQKRVMAAAKDVVKETGRTTVQA